MKTILEQILPVTGSVRKRRLVYHVGQTRVHLDRVEGLGDFLELEVVLRPDTNTHWEALAPLYDAALRAKYQKVSFAMTGAK